MKLIPAIPAKLISIKVNAVYPNWGEGPLHRRRVFLQRELRLVQAAQANLLAPNSDGHAPAPPTFICP